LNIDNLKVNKFIYGLHPHIKEKVHILMPKTLHRAMQRAIILEEELLGNVEDKNVRNPLKLFVPFFHDKPSHGRVHGINSKSSFPRVVKP